MCICGNTAVTRGRGWNVHRIRVSIQSELWRRQFSRRSCRDSNWQLFDHQSGARTNKLSRLPRQRQPMKKNYKQQTGSKGVTRRKCLRSCKRKNTLERQQAQQVSQLVRWCFEPSKPQRITSGLSKHSKNLMSIMIFLRGSTSNVLSGARVVTGIKQNNNNEPFDRKSLDSKRQ